MTQAVLPAQCAMALKEWATVLEAMARGEQVVLIRKGGLIEPGSGFELASSSFVFYPTFEHQAVNYLRAGYRGYVDEAATRRAADGQVRVDLAGVAVSSMPSRDPNMIERLREFHIYNQEFQTQRLKWQPEQPLVVIVVRVFRLQPHRVLTVIPRYAGCTSWVELETPVVLEGAQPVVGDAAFAQRLRGITEACSAG